MYKTCIDMLQSALTCLNHVWDVYVSAYNVQNIPQTCFEMFRGVWKCLKTCLEHIWKCLDHISEWSEHVQNMSKFDCSMFGHLVQHLDMPTTV